MAEIETLGILDEIQSIVSDNLQVVSYKWLSRKFLVTSNAAKRLLQEFVEKYGNGIEVIYSLSGWLKNNPSTYHIRLVTKHKLSDAKQEFDENCSIQVYSVQTCLPKDSATLWNHEFVQAEDLFKQSLTVDNCLRDNRFCGVSNSFIKRAGGGTSLGTRTLDVKTTGFSGLSKSCSSHQNVAIPLQPQKKVEHSSPNAGLQSFDTAKAVKTERAEKPDREQGLQLATDKEKVPKVLPKNKKGQSDKSSSITGGALANMWGRASTKSKPDAPLAQADNSRQSSAASAEAQISARESVDYGSSDEDGRDFSIKRTSNGEGGRKRRVVFDFSDEEDELQDAVSLASPDPPKQSSLCSKDSSNAFELECNLSFEEKENKPKIKEVKQENGKANQHLGEKDAAISKGKAESPPSDKPHNLVHETDASMKDKVDDAMPKRRKVLKTRIDERGREVTEVVWEGEEPDTKSDSNSAKTAENNSVKNALNRPPVAKKSPAVGKPAPGNPAGRAGNKKAGNKDPKQGNILAFFKKA